MPFFRPTLSISAFVLLLGPPSVVGATSEVDLIKDKFFSWLLPMLFNQSNTCYKDLSEVFRAQLRLEKWALSMLDAGGRPEANLLGGNYGWVGSYHQCIGIKKGSIEGQHCWITMKMESDGISAEFPSVGICFPKSCKNKDFAPITNSKIVLANKELSRSMFNASFAPSIDCEYSHIHYTMTSYVAIGIGCILLLLTLLGTSIDVLSGTTRDSEKKVHLNEEKMEAKSCTKKFCAAFNRVVLYFSLYSNGRKLFALEKESSDVTFSQLNGMKVMATAGVIFIHTYKAFLVIAKNPAEVGAELRSWFLQPFLQVQALDVFFLITGFLTLHVVLHMPEVKNKLSFVLAYILHRYLKMLVAPLTIVLVTQVAIKPHLFSGPFFDPLGKTCSFNWWSKVLLTNNYNTNGDCFPIWWFLSATVQLHLISLIIIVPLINKRYSWSILSGSALLIYSWSWFAWKAHHIGLRPLYPEDDNARDLSKYYLEHFRWYRALFSHPTVHLGSYLVGMGLAGLLATRNAGHCLSKLRVRVGWLLSAMGFYATVYLTDAIPHRMLRMLHMIFGPTIYGLSIAWVIFICDNKNNGVVSRMLRGKYWLLLSKLSLNAYLVHMLAIDYLFQSEYEKVLYSTPLLFSKFLVVLLLTYPLATVATLSIEMPISAIINALFRKLISTK